MTRRFPVLGDQARLLPSVPWEVIAPHEKQAHHNHAQSLETLARRGGLSFGEMLAVLEDRPWRRMRDEDALAGVLRHVAQAELPS